MCCLWRDQYRFATDHTSHGMKLMNMLEDLPSNGRDLFQSIADDLKLAASKMSQIARRSFVAAVSLKYCGGSTRKTERLFGWNRKAVALGLHEKRTGITCIGAQEAFSGDKLWEEKQPEVAKALWAFARDHSQQDPTFRTTLSFTRLTAAQALKQLRSQGFAEELLPSPSTMAEVLNRNGFRLRSVVKAKPQKKSPRRMPSLPISRTRTTSRMAMPNASG